MIESTPPFSYCEDLNSAPPLGMDAEGSPLRLSQPLVSFSPPFDAAPVKSRTPDGMIGREDAAFTVSSRSAIKAQMDVEAIYRKSRNAIIVTHTPSVLGASAPPALLETLPESPFSLRVRTHATAESHMVADASSGAGLHMASLPSPSMHGSFPNNRDPHGRNLSVAPISEGHEVKTVDAMIMRRTWCHQTKAMR